MSEGLIAYFGYGSLVNAETLRTDYVSIHPARLKGWRRHWQSRPPGATKSPVNPALLSVRQHADSEIDGVLIIDLIGALPELDIREALYDRVEIPVSDISLSQENPDLGSMRNDHLFVYVGRQSQQENPPLLQSYLDAVMSGLLKTHGVDGLKRFIETTDGFARDMVADRFNPIYPRAVSIRKDNAKLFDRLLLEAGVKPVPLD